MAERVYTRAELEELMRMAAGAAAGQCMRIATELEMPSQEISDAVDSVLRDHDSKEPLRLIEDAWGIIANANGGNWEASDPGWRHVAERWRDRYHAYLDREFADAADMDVGMLPDEDLPGVRAARTPASPGFTEPEAKAVAMTLRRVLRDEDESGTFRELLRNAWDKLDEAVVVDG